MRLHFDISALPVVGQQVTGISRVLTNILLECSRQVGDGLEMGGLSFHEEDSAEYSRGRRWSIKPFAAEPLPQINGDSTFVEPLDRSVEDFDSSDIIICLGEQWLFPHSVAAIKSLQVNQNVKVVTLVHDLVPFFMPELYWEGFSSRYKKTVTSLVEASDLILVNSECTKADLLKWIRPSRGKCVARLHLGSDLAAPPKKLNAFSKKTEGRFILCVGTIQPRKNHLVLLMAWRSMSHHEQERCPKLVIAGARGWNSSELMNLIENSPSLQKHITIIENPSDIEISWLYDNAWMTVYPSLYEGWGLPVAESLARGKMCLSSNTAALREVGGDFIEYFDPNDPAGLCKLVIKYLENPVALTLCEARIRRDHKVNTWVETAHEFLQHVKTLNKTF